MSQTCQLSWKSTNSVAIKGEIDAQADLSSFQNAAHQILYVDLGAVSRINSAGLKLWIQTIKKNAIELVLRECSPIIVEQYALVPDFLGKGGRIESFYVSYHCEGCDKEEHRRYQVPQDNPSSVNVLSVLDTACPACGGAFEIDRSPDVYQSVLNKSRKSGIRAS